MSNKIPMTEHEKSVLILKAMGWHPVVMPKYHSEGWYRLADEHGKFSPTYRPYRLPDDVWRSAPNLYNQSSTWLAWLAATWMGKFLPEFATWWREADLYLLRRVEEAQASWLDKIVELILKESK